MKGPAFFRLGGNENGYPKEDEESHQKEFK
jgi:hypothetical protein